MSSAQQQLPPITPESATSLSDPLVSGNAVALARSEPHLLLARIEALEAKVEQLLARPIARDPVLYEG